MVRTAFHAHHVHLSATRLATPGESIPFSPLLNHQPVHSYLTGADHQRPFQGRGQTASGGEVRHVATHQRNLLVGIHGKAVIR